MANQPELSRIRLSPSRGGTSGLSSPGIVWRGLEVMANNINKRGKTLNITRKLAMERIAKNMETYAKEHAPWQDRTGDAREYLQGFAQHDEGEQTSTAYLSHGVPYGLWLEIMNGGEFAIIIPTILAFQSQVLSTVVQVDSFSSLLAQVYGEEE